jgi:hypothetical protein
VIPSGLVITRLPVPSEETATKSPLPKATLRHELDAAVVLDVQTRPSGLVTTRLFAELVFTATKRPLP